jgi:hypothetical protein
MQGFTDIQPDFSKTIAFQAKTRKRRRVVKPKRKVSRKSSFKAFCDDFKALSRKYTKKRKSTTTRRRKRTTRK